MMFVNFSVFLLVLGSPQGFHTVALNKMGTAKVSTPLIGKKQKDLIKTVGHSFPFGPLIMAAPFVCHLTSSSYFLSSLDGLLILLIKRQNCSKILNAKINRNQ